MVPGGWSEREGVGGGLTWHLAETEGELVDLAPAWEGLLALSSLSEPTLTPFWLTAWWHVFGAGRRLKVCTFRRGRELVGLLPLVSRVHWHKPGIPFRRFELLGTGESVEDEIASEYVGPIAQRGAESEVAGLGASLLIDGALGSWDELVCRRMRARASTTRAWMRALEARGLELELFGETDSHYVPLPASWEEYLLSLSASRRYRIRRTLRDVREWVGGDVPLQRVRCPAELRRGREILTDLHGQRWRAGGCPGVFASARFSRFHGSVMPELLARGALDLLWVDDARGAPLAALYNIVWDGRVRFYQCGRRVVGLPPRLRPGVFLHALAIQRAIEKGCREYDFLAGGDRYKQELSLSVRELVSFRALRRRTVREDTRVILTRGARAAKKGLRRRASTRPTDGPPCDRVS